MYHIQCDVAPVLAYSVRLQGLLDVPSEHPQTTFMDVLTRIRVAKTTYLG